MKAISAILSHIHCIGFDMDHTIVRYNLPNLYKLVFNCLSTYMVDHEKFYPEYKNCALKPEYCAKGLVLDIVKGNCIKLDENKNVVKAVHGFKPLSEAEITSTYPDPIAEYNGHKTERYFTAISYFEATVCSLFLHAVELEEKHSSKPDFGKIVQALGRGFEHSFSKFPEGPYFKEMIANLPQYVYKASPDFIQWLQAFTAKGVKIALITNSFAEYTHLLMHYCYGEKFHELFDAVVVQAIKPAFFKHKEPFLEFETYFPDVDSPKFVQDLQLHRKPLPIFSKGNVFHLIESLERVYVAEHPENDVYESNKLKWCYVGDHMIGDVMVPKVELAWTTIAIVEEIEHLYHSNVAPEKGQHWGSFFYHDKNESEKFHTYYAKLLRESADYCCISVDDLVHIEEHQMDTHSLSPCVVIKPKTNE